MVKLAYRIKELDEFKEQFSDYKKYDVDLYIDQSDPKVKKKITTFLNAKEKKFKRILHVILSGKYDNDFYSQEGREIGIKHVTALKFKGRSNKNTRIYCKEIFQNGKKVVLITPLSKKVQKNNTAINNLLRSIEKSTYELKDQPKTG